MLFKRQTEVLLIKKLSFSLSVSKTSKAVGASLYLGNS
jgi:hypothetical protein